MKKERERKGERTEKLARLLLRARCLFVFIINETSRMSERWSQNWIWLALLWRSGNCSRVPQDYSGCCVPGACVCYLTGVCLRYSSVCVCDSVCVCVWGVGGGSRIHERDILLSRHFPLCFHSDLVGDWWLNCGVHVNSNWWFMKILRVSEAAQAAGEEKDIAF